MRSLCGLLGIAAVLVACGSPSKTPAAPRAVDAHTRPATHCKPRPINVNGDYFQPRRKIPTGALSAREAWTYWDRNSGAPRNPHARIPPNVCAHYGGMNGRRVYAFSAAHGPCMVTNPNYSMPPNIQCTEWTFLNAFTGRHIDTTWQWPPGYP